MPLILHNVPDDELYVGDDGVQRPYAMVFAQQEGHPGTTRSRRAVPETGSFGKSTRRARSRTGTPAKRDNPTLTAADKVFGDWINNQAAASNNNATTSNRKSMNAGLEETQQAQDRIVRSEPTEIILRGYRNTDQQYAAINHYEQLAGRICEDYPRQAPIEQRRYKSELSDPAFIRHKPLSPEERTKVNRAAGGEHWVKVTFESADAAESAVFASPQTILGYVVHAEPYYGHPPSRDDAIPDVDSFEDHLMRSRSAPTAAPTPGRGTQDKRAASFPDPFAEASPDSRVSSRTLDTTTLSTDPSNTLSSATATATATDVHADASGAAAPPSGGLYCRKIPSARRVKVLPAEQALLPQQSVMQRFTNAIPFLKWFSGSMIGNEVPRTQSGEFDWYRASLYWKFIWWLDATFGFFGGEIMNADKED